LGTSRDDNQLSTFRESPIAFGGCTCRNLILGRKQASFEEPAIFTKSETRSPELADSFAGETFSRSRSVVARVVAGETLIVPIRGKVGDLASIYSFNGTGTLIWKMLESPQTLKQLATGVAEAYDVDLSQAESDVVSFVGEMKVVGLVEVAASVAVAGD